MADAEWGDLPFDAAIAFFRDKLSMPTATWLDLLSAAGFVPEAITEVTTEDREPRICFVAKRPM